MNKGSYNHSRARKYKRRRKILYWVLIPILLLILAGIGYGTLLVSKAKLAADNSYDSIRNGQASKLRDKDIDPVKDSFSVLIIGVDTSDKRASDGRPRSDSLILATFNTKDSRVKMTSIPRDSYVHIADPNQNIDKYSKINAAHAYGGPELSVKTLEDKFKIPIDYYVRFDFEAFLKIIDALGGIDVDVPVSFTEQNSKDEANAISLKKGKQHLNGEEALALARTRHIDSDIERGKRQQLIIKAIVNESSKLTSINKYSKIIDAVGENMKTNFTFDQMLSLAKYGMTNKLELISLALKGVDAPKNGVYYYQLSENSVQSVANELAQELNIKKPFPNALPYSEQEQNKDNDNQNTPNKNQGTTTKDQTTNNQGSITKKSPKKNNQ